MTGYTVNTGSTKKFAESWDRIFSGKKKAGKKTAKTSKSAAAGKKGAAKKTGKKKAKKR